MPAEHADAAERERRLDEILVAYLEAVEVGETPDRQELLARHPDLAEDLAAFFADQDQFHCLVAPLRTDTPLPPQAALAAALTGPLAANGDDTLPVVHSFGDYELLEEIARGGMGVVYKARQVSLNRTVALKMILAGHFASPADVQRFRLEAEAAANLDHPHIESIYEVGEHEGKHFFSMKLVEGENLSRHALRFLQSPREAVRLVSLIADAVEHAHQRGILHRDLKPANILIDAQGQPHVTDFGLAKFVERGPQPAAHEEAGTPRSHALTQTGVAVGTPSYMAPEQAASNHKRGVTMAADVYSLGAILYELLGGQPPFRAETPLETLLQVMEKEPAPLRLLNPRIGRDLATIVHKCLDKDPERRYHRAEELAEDLHRYLRGEPIQARPVGQLERFVRWCARNPALALASSAACFLLAAVTAVLVLLVGSQSFYVKEISEKGSELLAANEKITNALGEAKEQRQEVERQKKEVEKHLQEAEQQRARAEENFRQAHQAVNEFTMRVSDELNQAPYLLSLRKELLTTALRYYQGFLEQHGDDDRIRSELASASFRLARIVSASGSKTEALAHYQRALAIYQELALASPGDLHLKKQLAQTLLNIGVVQDATAHPTQALASTRQALTLCEALVAARPDSSEFLYDLALAQHQLANLERAAGDTDSAFRLFQSARDLWEQLACAQPRLLRYQGDLALCLNNMGVAHSGLGHDTEALRLFEQALLIREKLVAEEPRNNESQLALAASYHDVGATCARLHRDVEALRYHEQAHALRERLAQDNPNFSLYQSDLAGSLGDLASMHRAAGRLVQALDYYKKALAIQRGLVRVDPSVSHYQRDVGRTLFAIGVLLNDNRQKDDAARAYRDARAVQEKLVQADPARVEHHNDLGHTLNNLGVILGQLGHLDEALGVLEQAVAEERLAFDRMPQAPGYRRALNNAYGSLGEVQRALGHPADAFAPALERRKLWPGNATELVRVAGDMALTAAKDKDKASPKEQAERQRYADEAIAILRQALEAGYPNPERLESDPHLASLRSREDFQELIAAFKKP
jgi:serine/threonine-protein kinase